VAEPEVLNGANSLTAKWAKTAEVRGAWRRYPYHLPTEWVYAPSA